MFRHREKIIVVMAIIVVVGLVGSVILPFVL